MRLSSIKARAALFAAAVVLSTATVARANLFIDLVDATTGARNETVTATNNTFTLDVYGLVTPNGSNTANNLQECF